MFLFGINYVIDDVIESPEGSIITFLWPTLLPLREDNVEMNITNLIRKKVLANYSSFFSGKENNVI